MAGFNLIALDCNYQILALLRPTNVQWSRKYHEPGSFSLQLPLEQYLPEIKYIYTKDRPEIGKVIQVNFLGQQGYQYIQLSGYFEENELNRHIVYPKGSGNIVNSPAWIEKKGSAEDVAYAFFDGFKELSANGLTSSLGIERGSSLARGKTADHTRNGEYLGDKIYDILKPSGMSYRVRYNFVDSARTFEVWGGLDRTEENVEQNNPIVFSTKYGNIRNPNVLISEENYKNAGIVINECADGDSEIVTTRAAFHAADNGRYSFAAVQSEVNKSDYTDSDFVTALDNEIENALNEAVKVVNVEFDALAGSYEYMQDFDIGDLCTLEIPEMSLSADARLIGCYEVMKSGQWSMSMEFGTPIIRRNK